MAKLPGFFVVVALLPFLGAGLANAQQAECLAVAEAPGRFVPARFASAALEAHQAKLTYIGHSSFVIESPQGVRIVTDYAGNAGGFVPDVVTMNRAHSSHFTDFPDPAIKHVLRGWNDDGTPAQHDLAIGDVRIRNVTTDIRGGMSGVHKDGNSIFIFEVGDLCIGHLGHLHHPLGPEHMALIGRLDIVMVPVDGGYTMAQSEMKAVLDTLKVRAILPMHYFTEDNLGRFIVAMRDGAEATFFTSSSHVFSADELPAEPVIYVFPGG